MKRKLWTDNSENIKENTMQNGKKERKKDRDKKKEKCTRSITEWGKMNDKLMTMNKKWMQSVNTTRKTYASSLTSNPQRQTKDSTLQRAKRRTCGEVNFEQLVEKYEVKLWQVRNAEKGFCLAREKKWLLLATLINDGCYE